VELLNKELILKEIPLFSGLTTHEIQVIRERSEIVEYKKGDFIYREGSSPSGFYCLILGRVQIYTQAPGAQEIVLEYLHRGKYFGIISLLTDEPHSVTAQAINDCLILVIKKEDFVFILNKIPRIAIDLSQTLSRRLKRKDVHQKSIFESTIISVFSSYSQAGKTVYALNLSLSLKKETHKSVIILDILPGDQAHSMPRRLETKEAKVFDLSAADAMHSQAVKDFINKSPFGIDFICFHYKQEDESCVRKLVGIISLLVNDYHYLVLDLPSIMDRCIFSILNQSDVIHTLTSPDEVDLMRTRHLKERLIQEFNFREDKIKVIINEYKFSKISHEEQVRILGKPVFATLPKINFEASDRLILDNPEGEYAKAVRRIARQLGECQVGLVLGVGVGYGFCHIGVLKVIEEEKIPIDVIAGSSIGSIIASLWAAGYSSQEILDITKEFKGPAHIWGLIDITFPWLGLLKGGKLRKFLKKYLNNKTFYDVRLPLKIIASDVRHKEPRIIDKGLLVDAVMASAAMPGIFAPFKFKEEMLFDGGVINPLPTEPLLKMGIKKIIAVNVTPTREDIIRQYAKLKEQISVTVPHEIKKRKWFSAKEHIKEGFKTNILDIIFSSVEILQAEVAEKEARLADVVLHPDTSGLYWLELHKAAEFAHRGEEETRRNLDKIRQLINE
jgi:NTE family protein